MGPQPNIEFVLLHETLVTHFMTFLSEVLSS